MARGGSRMMPMTRLGKKRVCRQTLNEEEKEKVKSTKKKEKRGAFPKQKPNQNELNAFNKKEVQSFH